MLKNKSLILSFFLTFLTLVLLVVSTLAWIIARPAHIDNIVVQTGNLEMDVVLEYSHNGGPYIKVTNDLTFANILPGDKFDFRLTINNKSTVRGHLSAQVKNITRSVEEPNIDMAKELIMYSSDLTHINNKSIKDLILTSDYFTLVDDYINPSTEPIIYNFSIVFNESAGNEYQNKFLKIGQIVVRLDQ